ncbi:MAG: ABC transporter ATP-binding protein, partial [Bacteriovoracaceae bacterium]|nr:ABC transporter ATP-binding protein [Bacteriovoracaceae bacterium]
KKYQIISEALGGIKELKLHGKEELYVNDYDGVSEKCVHVTTYNTIIVHISRSFLEIMSFGIIISAVVFLVKSGQKITDFLPLLSLFAMAGLRLIPSLQQLFASITVIKANTYSLDLTFEDLKKSMQAELTKEKEIKRAPYPLVKSLKLSNVDYRYSGTHQNVLNELNIEVNSNTSIGIVGPTGAGKSTLVDIILGLLKPTSGDLIIDGNKISTKEQLKKWQASIGYVPQSIYLLDNTIAKNIAFTLEDESIDQVRLQDAARLAQLEEFILSKPDGYQTFVGERGVQISGGQRQRIGIARALYQSPSILIFDEATSALDNVTEKSIMMAINKLSKDRTIIMIAHRLTTVKDCDLILFLKNGRVTSQGSFDELVQTNSEFRKMLEA